MKKNRIPSEADHRTVQAGRRYGALVLTMLACAALTCPALAADDPLTIVGNLSDADSKNTFDIERFLKRRLKLKSDEQYDVFEVNVSDADE